MHQLRRRFVDMHGLWSPRHFMIRKVGPKVERQLCPFGFYGLAISLLRVDIHYAGN